MVIAPNLFFDILSEGGEIRQNKEIFCLPQTQLQLPNPFLPILPGVWSPSTDCYRHYLQRAPLLPNRVKNVDKEHVERQRLRFTEVSRRPEIYAYSGNHLGGISNFPNNYSSSILDIFPDVFTTRLYP